MFHPCRDRYLDVRIADDRRTAGGVKDGSFESSTLTLAIDDDLTGLRHLARMSIGGISNIGAMGLYDAADRFARSAERTADGRGDLALQAVEQTLAETQFDASLALIRTGDDMTKRLLNIVA